MNQLTITYESASDTSLEAARRIAGFAATLRARVLVLLKDSPDGLTDEEIQQSLCMEGSTERPRRVELQRMGLVVDSGRTRPTKSGRMATVWKAV